MRKIGCAFFLFDLVILLLTSIASARMLKQERDNEAAVTMTVEEDASLGDPFFNLVLKAHSTITKLSEIENLIQPDPDKRQTFVVHETITDPTPGQQRRAVFSFRGENKGEQLTANLMMSVFFDSEAFQEVSPVEAWGWDSRRGRYNYYKLDKTGTPQTTWNWKFRGSSEGADVMVPAQRAGTCMACHINGAPVMKELGEPWNNWHSPRSPASYLTDASSEGEHWKVATDERVKNDRLKVAEELEVTLLSALSQFNRHRIDGALARTASGKVKKTRGMMTVIDARRLLRPLFVTTEINLISSVQKSGLHPFPLCTKKGPDEPVVVPNSFFLNANLINGGTLAQYKGLGLSPALEFERVAKINATEYSDLTESLQVGLGGRVPGDADFAWFVPEPSHIDNDLIDQLLRQGIVSREFVAAVISVDLETPLFSHDRESLLDFIPNSFKFRPNSSHPSVLTTLVIQEIEKRRPAPTLASGRFLSMLKSPDPVKILRKQIVKYQARVKSSLENLEKRQATIEALYRRALNVRRALAEHKILRKLDETRGLEAADMPTNSRLLPLPTSRGSGC